MATTAVCGSTGSTSLGGEVTRWTLNLNQDTPEVTSMNSAGYKEYISCLRDADGTLTSYTSLGAIGAHASVVLTAGTKGTFTMNIIVTSLSTEVDANGVVTFNYSFVSTGAIT
jgi:predicted secreted protein